MRDVARLAGVSAATVSAVVNGAAIALLPVLCALAQDYRLGPDSMRQPSVPQGKVTKKSWTSRIYPGTTRDYWVYVPAQYRPEQPAALMVFLDGAGFVAEDGAWRVPVVFDNLIERGDMPVTLGVFIDPGVLPARIAGQPPRPDRSYEYDALGDRFARFLLEEILPQVTKDYNLSRDPNARGIGGSSSGGICAFTVAWERPNEFRRVLSFVGSFTNLRGGEIYPSLIRKTEPKPIRIFLQDGEKDLNVAAGNWFIGAHDMVSALDYGGYEENHVWGVEGHNSKHGASILPDALRWLWHGYPAPIAKPKGGNGERQWSVLLTQPEKDWELVGHGYAAAAGLAADKNGNIFFSDAPRDRIYRIGSDGAPSVFLEQSGGTRGLAAGPDGRLYAAQTGHERVVAYSADGKESVIAEHVPAQELAVTARGEVYCTDPLHKRVWFIDVEGGKRVVEEGIEAPAGVLLWPGQAFLVIDRPAGRGIWWYQAQPDGSLTNGDSLYRLETRDDSLATDAGGMAVDTEGFLYVPTNLGIQVFDPPGRVMAILNPPQSGSISSVVIGGPAGNLLYATTGDKLFRRPLQHKAAISPEPAHP